MASKALLVLALMLAATFLVASANEQALLISTIQ